MDKPPTEVARPLCVGAIVVAAGAGRRMGAGPNKILRDLGGRTVLEWSVLAMLADPRVVELVVVVRPFEQTAIHDRLSPAMTPACRLKLAAGGDDRSESVRNGVAAAAPDLDILVVHDAARPFASRELLSQVINQAAALGAAIPALAVADTLKRVRDGQVVETVDRSGLFGAQTPQAFRARVLKSAFTRAFEEGPPHTDEASLLERLGVPVAVVPGDPLNLKITRSADFELAARLLRGRDPERTPPAPPAPLGGSA